MSKERLTERHKNGIAMVKGCGENCKYGFSYCRKDEWENCKTISDLIDKLAEYEDLEEQGLLLKLPCKVGDTIYYLMDIDDEVVVAEREICTLANVVSMMENGYFGKTVFLTQGEAAVKLR